MNSSRIRKKSLYINFLQWNWEPLLYEKQAYKKYQRNCNVEKKFWGLPSTFMQDVYSTLVLCSHEIKRCLLLGRKVMTNLDSIFKSRDITLLTKFCQVKAMVFPVVTYGCESWTVKKAERPRIGAFELWCWRRPLRVPWTARRSNQSILKEINPGISLEGWC